MLPGGYSSLTVIVYASKEKFSLRRVGCGVTETH